MRTDPKPNGSTIRTLRVARHLSTSELARRAGISRQYMSRIQSGKRGASLEVINAIATELNCAVDAIVRDPS